MTASCYRPVLTGLEDCYEIVEYSLFIKGGMPPLKRDGMERLVASLLLWLMKSRNWRGLLADTTNEIKISVEGIQNSTTGTVHEIEIISEVVDQVNQSSSVLSDLAAQINGLVSRFKI